jgi:hypothetical protein
LHFRHYAELPYDLHISIAIDIAIIAMSRFRRRHFAILPLLLRHCQADCCWLAFADYFLFRLADFRFH